MKSLNDKLIDILNKHKYYLEDKIENIEHRADLRGVDLSDADLRGADLSDAGLRGADLSNTNLRGADLSNAYLSGVDLNNADLRGVDLSGAIAYQVPPSCGAFIGWKKVMKNLIVKLKILEDSKRSSALVENADVIKH